jgi:elongation factor G
MQVRRKLKHNCAAIQYPIGLEDQLQGLVDLVQNRAFFFHGVHGEKVTEADMPNDIVPAVAEKRRELIEAISEVDEELADLFLNDHPITPDELAVCTNLCTISSFSPL